MSTNSFVVFGGGAGQSTVTGGSYVLSCGTTDGSTTVTSSALFGPIQNGATVTGTGIESAIPSFGGALNTTKVVAVASTSSLTLNQAATATGTNNLTFTPVFPVLTYKPAWGGGYLTSTGAGVGHIPLIQGITPMANNTFSGITINPVGTGSGITYSQPFLTPPSNVGSGDCTLIVQVDTGVTGSPVLSIQLQGSMTLTTAGVGNWVNVGSPGVYSGGITTPKEVLTAQDCYFPKWRIQITNSDGSSSGTLDFIFVGA